MNIRFAFVICATVFISATLHAQQNQYDNGQRNQLDNGQQNQLDNGQQNQRDNGQSNQNGNRRQNQRRDVQVRQVVVKKVDIKKKVLTGQTQRKGRKALLLIPLPKNIAIRVGNKKTTLAALKPEMKVAVKLYKDKRTVIEIQEVRNNQNDNGQQNQIDNGQQNQLDNGQRNQLDNDRRKQ